MGIQDREYYRERTRGSAWFSGAAPACRTIILINVAVWVLDQLTNDNFARLFAVTSEQIFQDFQVWRLLTATFLHGDPIHILFNMLILWMVGREIEAIYGSRDFVAFYLSSAIVSTFCWALADYTTGDRTAMMLGASGAVLATAVLYTLYNPRREILLFFLFPIEMRWLLTLIVGYDALQLIVGKETRVALVAHLAGAAFGYLYKVADLRLSRLMTQFGKRRPRLRVVSSDAPTREVRSNPRTPFTPSVPPGSTSNWTPSVATPQRPTPMIVTEEQLNDKLDEILVKIAREGRDGLSEDEKRILEEASRRARNRRSERI